ncbi:alpha/beta hydrolase family protein [Actinomyces ruminicola]|uniref:Alpha/beta hydrolase family protein n=1 Tax=Actinomyces ruminicola TaxID=332524 RepID=A0A1G9VNF1_9ACTO|nr:prolyl oligopeptidase family serine peptidase [Actinomyces ruminicola]SDM73630.1 Alpha/beta hydrolase family protein [Actinomyces ruminicola]
MHPLPDSHNRPERETRRERPKALLPRRLGPKRQPARITRAELRSGWAWLREFPHRAWVLLAWLWRTERRRTLIVLAAAIGVAAFMGLLGTGGREIWEILLTLALGALVLAVSTDHRIIGGVVVTVLVLSLVGTLAGPRWNPQPVTDSLTPVTADTTIGGTVATAAVGTYEFETTTITITQADGEEVPALLRRPIGVEGDTPGVVFMHGAGTHGIWGFTEQGEALASAGVTTLVPSKPMEDYSTTERNYLTMAADYQRSLDYLIALDGVDSEAVGIYGESEGAIPGVVLTAEDDRVAFLILASAPVVRLREQAALAVDTYMRNVGVPEAMLTLIPRVLGSARIPGGGFEYADFDSVAYLETISVPILMLYGTADASMPLVQGPTTVWSALQTGGNDQFTVRYYDGANHGLKLGITTDGSLAPGVTRDLSRWVAGLPETADAEPHVAGATPTQAYWAQTPDPTRWYASGDLMLATLIIGFGLMVLSGLVWLLGQGPRLRGRRGLHLPDPIGRWSVSLCLSVTAAWVLYVVYILGVASLATSYRTNHLFSYGGWVVVQLVAFVAVVILVKLAYRARLMRAAAHAANRGHGEKGRWLTIPAAGVLTAVLIGATVLLVAIAYWGLFPMLV